PIITGRLGDVTDRLRPIPSAVELAKLTAVRPEERHRQINLTLRKGRIQKLPGREHYKVGMRFTAGQVPLNCLIGLELASLELAGFERVASNPRGVDWPGRKPKHDGDKYGTKNDLGWHRKPLVKAELKCGAKQKSNLRKRVNYTNGAGNSKGFSDQISL